MIVAGLIEPIAEELPWSTLRLNRRIEVQMEGTVG